MSLRVLAVLLAAVLLAALSPARAPFQAQAQALPVPPGWQLERAILLSRHGVRAPLESNEVLDRTAASPWPAWPVASGRMTPRGADLLRLMGTYYRVLYGGRGLVQTDDCPPVGTVAAWADVEERTRESAAAVLSGMYPRCGDLILRMKASTADIDPLFHAQRSASCPIDPAAVRGAILARIGGDFSSVTREYAPQLARMGEVLCPPGVADGGRCAPAQALSTLEVAPDGRPKIVGPIGTASTAAESFLMEAADGWPAAQVAWGRLRGDGDLVELLGLHRLAFDLTQKTPIVARANGSSLLAQITDALVDGRFFPGLPPNPSPVRFGLLMGHDTNIANVQSLLKLGWQIPGFQANEASPGGALAFELYREGGSGLHYVRVAYVAQTLPQLREATPLGLASPPGIVAVELPECAAQARDKACPLSRFVEIAKAAVDLGCVTLRP
ncbi:MAG: histidine-type phosphatase [Reyranellaceae bacterium]